MAIGYALFNKIDGKLYPQYVLNNEPVPVGEWVEAREDAEWYVAENGRKYLKHSKLSRLAWRPGKHLALVPLFNQIGMKQPDGTLARRSNTVICEVEYKDDIDWTVAAEERSKELHNGKLVRYDCCLDHLPYEGFYRFQTNASAKVPWIICHKYKVVREITETEEAEICKKFGVTPQKVA